MDQLPNVFCIVTVKQSDELLPSRQKITEKKTAETRQCVAEVPSVVATAALRAQSKEVKRDT